MKKIFTYITKCPLCEAYNNWYFGEEKNTTEQQFETQLSEHSKNDPVKACTNCNKTFQQKLISGLVTYTVKEKSIPK